MFTAWGYEVDLSGFSDQTSLPPLISVYDFDEITGGAYTNEVLVSSALKAASQAVRNACGWHVSPSLPCSAKLTASGKLAKIPAMRVSSVTSVSEYDQRNQTWAALSIPGEVEVRHDGLMRRLCFKNFSQAWDGIEVHYTAGFDSMPDLAYAVANIAEGVLSLPKGVLSESADGVSISYSTQAQSVASAMTEQMRAQLAPYRLVSNHAV